MNRWEQARSEWRREKSVDRFTGKRGLIAVLSRLSVAAVVLRTGEPKKIQRRS